MPFIVAEEEENLLEDINNYRQKKSLPKLEESDKASCLAEKIADDLEDQPCENAGDYYPSPGEGTKKIPRFEKLVKKCKINVNSTIDGVVMPVCVPNLDRNSVLSNYTESDHYAKYVNSSDYTGAGVGSENDWMVLVLTTNTSSGSFSSASSLLADACKGRHLLLALFLALFFVALVN